MKWLAVPKQSPRKDIPATARPFLVLPRVCKTDRLMTGGTWPPPPRRPRSRRPSTATLERPILLDIELLNKIDMSLVRKEFLCITNLCRSPVAASSSLPASPRVKIKKLGDKETSDESPENDENSTRSRSNKIPKTTKPSPTKKLLKPKPKVARPAKITRAATVQSEPSTNTSAQSTTISTTPTSQSKRLPTPCTTCGRAEQPERLHSHPPPQPPQQSKIKEIVKQKTNIMKSSVQKPLPIKFKSKKKPSADFKKDGKKEERKQEEVCDVKKDAPAQNYVRPRTLTCYICGREFGTASLPLHEPKCLQKWERENSELPRNLQRKPPIKPSATSNEEWNKSAWEASQASLVPCPNCSRTFLPDRLVVHQRSCRPSPRQLQKRASLPGPPSRPLVQDMQSTSSPGPNSPGPPTVRCYICGRMFGTKSIGIHEPQCLKKWHTQNDRLPPDKRLPGPLRSTYEPYPDNLSPERSEGSSSKVSNPSPIVDTSPVQAGVKKHMLSCYVCGREFGVTSIYIHEPQCLKKWKAENEKLPVEKRKPEPQRPDIKFTQKQHAESDSTLIEDGWNTYLARLMPCKTCGRTFDPSRIERHQKICKANN